MALADGFRHLPLAAAVLLLGAASCASAAASSKARLQAPRAQLTWDRNGRLVFADAEVRQRVVLAQTTRLRARLRRGAAAPAGRQGRGGTSGGHAPLYDVSVNVNLEDMVAADGVTALFDKNQHIMRVEPGISKIDGFAWGNFDDKISTTGWSSLHLETTTQASVSNDVRMYSAGFVEGLLTCVRLSEYYANMHKLLMRREAVDQSLLTIKELFKRQISYMEVKSNLVPHILADEPTDPYWKHTRYILFQIWGLCDGYNYAALHFGVHTLGLEDMLFLNSGGELANLMEAFSPKAMSDRAVVQSLSFLQKEQQRRVAEDPLDDEHWERRVQETGHCSALIKVSSDKSDLLMGHTTWDDYSRMTRIFKHYKFNLDGASTMASNIAFSSYPGTVSSTDDFYVMSSGLVTMETTLELLNKSPWDSVTEFSAVETVPNFVHIMIANRMAKSGAHWATMMAKQNTGTYASQWMIVDYGRFQEGVPPPDDTLWVLEMVPGLVHFEDMSSHLRTTGFWPSFNRPYFAPVRSKTGHADAELSHGTLYSWTENPRAMIFSHLVPEVDSLYQLRTVITHNSYPNSGVEPAMPGHEIMARFDLNPMHPIPNGGIDAKVVNRCLAKEMIVQGYSSPSHSALEPFRWTTDGGMELWPGFPHIGLPNVWNFDWVQFTPYTTTTNLNQGSC